MGFARVAHDPLQRPPVTVAVVQQRFRFGRVRHFKIRAIPLEPLTVQFVAEPDGDAAEQHGFSQRSGKSEIRFRRRSGFAGLDELFVMADRARERFRRKPKVPVLRFKNEPVDFPDAWLAARAAESKTSAASFDKDLDRFPDVTRCEPKA